MYAWELHQLSEEIDGVKDFFKELASRESELAIAGLASVRYWQSYRDCAALMRNFDANMHKVFSHARTFDREIFESIRNVMEQNGLSEAISIVNTRIEFAASEAQRTLVSIPGNTIALIKSKIRKKRLFVDEGISLTRIVASITRLCSLLALLRDREMERYRSDDQIFKPSNVDIDRVLNYIDQALFHVNSELRNHPQIVDIIVYLELTKRELADARPSWKNIVGALVIVATILSGVAAAPEAYQNVKAALDHILGTSVERVLLPPAPPRLPADSNGDLDDEIIET